jgi:ketosteroid isomerase-like protein
MSRENVEVVRTSYQTWNAGDMVALHEMYDPDAVLVRGLEGWPETVPVVGRDAVIAYFEQLRETWDSDSVEAVSLDDAGDSVVVRTIWRGVGHGPDLNLEWTVVCTLRRGRIFLLEYFWDHAEALEAVGLSEQDAHADS